ncbi:hypothetical protein [Nocardia alni]|nr:hypothetical protein [Nocardia alni]
MLNAANRAKFSGVTDSQLMRMLTTVLGGWMIDSTYPGEMITSYRLP